MVTAPTYGRLVRRSKLVTSAVTKSKLAAKQSNGMYSVKLAGGHFIVGGGVRLLFVINGVGRLLLRAFPGPPLSAVSSLELSPVLSSEWKADDTLLLFIR